MQSERGKVNNIFKLNISSVRASQVAQKNLPVNAGDTRDVGSIPGSERSPGEGNGILLQYSCLGNPMNRGTWWATGHGVLKSWT